MGLLRAYRPVFLASLVWLAVELASFSAFQFGNATVVAWLPSGIAVATLLLLARNKWAPFLSIILVLSLTIGAWAKLPFNVNAAFALTHVLQPPLMVVIAQRVSRGLSIQALRLSDLVGFTIATAASSLITIPIFIAFGISHEPVHLAYVMLATMLGTVVVAPIALTIRERLAGGKRACDWEVLASLIATGVVLFVLTVWVLQQPETSYLFLPTSVVVLAVARRGQIGAAAGLLAFSLAVTIKSFGGQPSAEFMQMTREGDAVFLQFYMVVLLAASLPLAALLLSHDRLASRLARGNRRLRQDLTMLSMAESLAGIGRWRRNLVTGEREMSREVKIMLGLDPNESVTDRESVAMHVDGGVSLRAQTERNRTNRHPFQMDMHIRRPDGEERYLRMFTKNEFDADGKICEVFGVIMDFTDQRRREEALDRARKQAMRLAAEAQLLAQTDALTGLANRRRTLVQLEKCIAAAREDKKALSVIGFDVDHFKRVNDSHGHQTGDEVLKRVAELARQQVRESDVIGRTGGEEFVWILPGADEDVARSAAERLRLAIEAHSAEGGLPGVTASIGVATWREWEGPGDVLKRADIALYDAKHNGRNQVSKAA